MGWTMTERPILFSGPMVKAILDGRKAQTRRVSVQPQITGERPMWRDAKADLWREKHHFIRDCCPYGKPGDRLWIKTGYTTRYDTMFDHTMWSVEGVGFITTHGRAYSKSGKAKRDGGHPAMFMPQWLSAELRLPELEISDVRVHRLDEISEEDALAEGIIKLPATGRCVLSEGAQYFGNAYGNARTAFTALWDSINGKTHPWAANEWAWAITFKRLEATP